MQIHSKKQNEGASSKASQSQKAIPDELLTKKELCKKLKVSGRKIELDPNMPCIRWGFNVRYSWPHVMDYLMKKGGKDIV